MKYRDLRDFVQGLEQQGELCRVTQPVSPHLEMTALADRVLRSEGPALFFERPTGHTAPVLANLFGTPERVASFEPAALRAYLDSGQRISQGTVDSTAIAAQLVTGNLAILQRNPALLVVFMTGFSDRIRALQAAGVAVLAKPFTAEDLVNTLALHLGERLRNTKSNGL